MLQSGSFRSTNAILDGKFSGWDEGSAGKVTFDLATEMVISTM